MSTNDTPRTDALTSADTCIAGHARTLERELAAAQAKIANQSDRIRYLEGATNHAIGTPLSQAHAKIAALEAQLEAHAWTVSPAMAQAQIHALNAKIAELERALDFNLQGNRESVARIEQLEREPAAALATIAELERDKARLDWLFSRCSVGTHVLGRIGQSHYAFDPFFTLRVQGGGREGIDDAMQNAEAIAAIERKFEDAARSARKEGQP
jgi:chromosome segregation ATPase